MFPGNLGLDEITITYGNNKKSSLTDIIKLNFDDYRYINLKTMDTYLSLKNGRGLYSTLVIGNSRNR